MRSRLLLVASVGLATLYRVFLREQILTWGTTTDEATRTLPGDELLETADGIATRAIGIDAPPGAIWPWIAQMGPWPRGGAYTFDWIENLLGLNMHSVDSVLPAYQHPQIGDTIGYGPNQMRVERVEPEHFLGVALRGWQLGVDVRHRGARRLNASDQSQSLSPAYAPRPSWHGLHGARFARDGVEDAARDQSARREPR